VGKTDLCADRPSDLNCNDFLQLTGAVLLILDGIGQAGGIGMILQGLFMSAGPSKAVRGRSDKVSYGYDSPAYDSTMDTTVAPRHLPLTYARDQFRVTAVPFIPTNSSLGLGLVGNF
jgi:hypothetical protein